MSCIYVGTLRVYASTVFVSLCIPSTREHINHNFFLEDLFPENLFSMNAFPGGGLSSPYYHISSATTTERLGQTSRYRYV